MPEAIKNKPWFLILMPVFLFLHIEKDYFRLIDYTIVAAEISWLLTGTVLIVVIPLLLIGYTQRSWLIAFFSLLFFYYLGPLKDWLHGINKDLIFGKYIFFIPVSAILFLLIVWIIIRSKKSMDRFVLFLNMLLVTLVVVDLASILLKMSERRESQMTMKDFSREVKLSEEDKPDIYYIVFDMYTSSSVLREEFSFDNTIIEEYLVSKGFRVLKNSESNYNLTPFSIGSILNMDYIEPIDTTNIITQEKFFPGFISVAENKVFNFFEKQGYDIRNLSSFNISGYPRMKESYDIWQTGSIIYKHNFIKKLFSDIGWHFIKSDNDIMPAYMQAAIAHDEQVAKNLSQPVTSGKPHFVYAHFFKPHDPYTHDSTAIRSKPITSFSPGEEKELYTAQVKYANKMMQKITTSLLTRTKRPLVILFQGDHGFRFSMDPQKRWMEFKNFTAVYFSDKNYQLFSDEFSGVNTFRVVLNSWFQQKLPVLQHQTYHLKYKLFPAESN